MKYPLQIEIEKSMSEAFNEVSEAYKSGDVKLRHLASKYYDAIKRINDICVNRKRY